MAFELYNKELIKNFVFAGNATFTVFSKKSQKHLTFKVKKAKKGTNPPFFVSVLTGADNVSNYTYLGCIWKKGNSLSFYKGKKSKITSDSISSKFIDWFIRMLNQNKDITEQCIVLRDNKCGRCGRKLTNPKSIVTGIGPICSTKI